MTEAPAAKRALRVVLFLYSLGYLRLFDSVIQALLERGHAVHLLLERDFGRTQESEWLEKMARHPQFTFAYTDSIKRERLWAFGRDVRRVSDYLYFIDHDSRGHGALLRRSELRMPPTALRLMQSPPMRIAALRHTIAGLVRLIERALPISTLLTREIAAVGPDVLVVSPHLMPGAHHGEYVRVARSESIPCCMCIASWDNLSSKQQIREVPERLVVWNELQKREAVELHRIPPERIQVTGAQGFDLWFDWQPRSREVFCERVGLDAARPYVLYLAGSLFPARRTEAEWVRDTWLPELRRDRALKDVQIAIRPHPRRSEQWSAVDFGDLEDVVVWPRAQDAMPLGAGERADYFDSIYHSAAVAGLNTSAMIEAAIVGRSVHTILDPEFAGSQSGTFHFDYLLEVGGGLLRVARSFDEHRDQLNETLAGRDAGAHQRRLRFLEAFVRPLGLERPATDAVVRVIEQTAELEALPGRSNAVLVPVRVVVIAALRLRRNIRRFARLWRLRPRGPASKSELEDPA
jgi:hypothetical protein